MNFRTSLIPTLCLAFAWLAAAPAALAQVESRISSRFLARGEKAIFEIVSDTPDRWPEIPPVPNVVIEPRGIGPIRQPGRRQVREYGFQFEVVSYAVGRHVIPPVEVIVNGETSRTPPVEFQVFNPDDLEIRDMEVGGRPTAYAAAFMVAKERPYKGEIVPVEIKVYVPRDVYMTIVDWSVPEFEREGVTAWRFEPSALPNEVNILGRPYIGMAYPSTLSPINAGPVSIGPASVRLTMRRNFFDNFGPRNAFEEVNLQVPALELDARDLPPGAPRGFENAVGDFAINARTTATTVHEGDPVSVELTVSGRGNLDALRPPTLVDDEGWKTYEAVANQRGEERRGLYGSVVFQQFMRPLGIRSAIPPFRLVFFDPDQEEYRTVSTSPIPLEVIPTPATAATANVPAAPQALPVPVERMTDILSVLKPAQLLAPAGPALPAWTVHALGGLAALALVIKALWMRYAPRLRRDPVREERKRDLQRLAATRGSGDAAFLKAAGAFIERWLGHETNPELREILAERDTVCFREESPAVKLDRRRREAILARIRRAAVAIALFATLVLSTGTARAATADEALDAYESGQYHEAIRLWLGAGDYRDLAPDVLYNIGNASYRLGSPGHAALYYRRALERDPSHAESRQNLRFIERKHGAITVDRPEYQYALSKLPLDAWKTLVWTGAWLTVLGLLAFPATRPGARLRIAAVCGLVAGPLLASCAALGWYYFPDDSKFAPVDRQAVVIAPEAVLHADAARTAPEVIDAPPGSLCEVLQTTGRWAYIGFATQTRGWIPLESIERVIPESPPAPPEIKKPEADGSST